MILDFNLFKDLHIYTHKFLFYFIYSYNTTHGFVFYFIILYFILHYITLFPRFVFTLFLDY